LGQLLKWFLRPNHSTVVYPNSFLSSLSPVSFFNNRKPKAKRDSKKDSAPGPASDPGIVLGLLSGSHVHHSFISNGVGDGFLLPTSVGEILSTINAPPGGLPLVISQNISKPAVLPHLSGDVVVVQVSLSPLFKLPHLGWDPPNTILISLSHSERVQ